ncbi:MAG: isochorismatase family cysteine hydrolase [Dehalococcoidia bacterium]|nr:isochorismatase family cysteine hydrolase [Dehalococcoidia bacterium]MDZ4247425.1 isochorismatase family cysteine hydrolase [Dehalococcoidia bacterium]
MMDNAPAIPAPKPITLKAITTALLVLDQSEQSRDPALFATGYQLIPSLTRMITKARGKGLFIIFTYSFVLKGTPDGKVYSGYDRRDNEPVLTPHAFDKFQGSEMDQLLKEHQIDTLIITGSRSNICVMHTAVTAARFFNYHVVIPLDGTAANSRYEYEYSINHLTFCPGGVSDRFSFTTIDGITLV